MLHRGQQVLSDLSTGDNAWPHSITNDARILELLNSMESSNDDVGHDRQGYLVIVKAGLTDSLPLVVLVIAATCIVLAPAHAHTGIAILYDGESSEPNTAHSLDELAR
jgi:hypothetical protein